MNVDSVETFSPQFRFDSKGKKNWRINKSQIQSQIDSSGESTQTLIHLI